RVHDDEVPGAVHREDGEQGVGAARRVGDVDELGEVGAAGSVVVEEVQHARRVGRADVHVEAGDAGRGGAARVRVARRGLEHLAGDLVDRRVPVTAEGRVVRAVAGRRLAGG